MSAILKRLFAMRKNMVNSGAISFQSNFHLLSIMNIERRMREIREKFTQIGIGKTLQDLLQEENMSMEEAQNELVDQYLTNLEARDRLLKDFLHHYKH